MDRQRLVSSKPSITVAMANIAKEPQMRRLTTSEQHSIAARPPSYIPTRSLTLSYVSAHATNFSACDAKASTARQGTSSRMPCISTQHHHHQHTHTRCLDVSPPMHREVRSGGGARTQTALGTGAVLACWKSSAARAMPAVGGAGVLAIPRIASPGMGRCGGGGGGTGAGSCIKRSGRHAKRCCASGAHTHNAKVEN